MTRADEQRLRDLADRALVEAGGDALEQLLAEASLAPKPGAVLARVFGCNRNRLLQERDLWLARMAARPIFAARHITKRVEKVHTYLGIYQGARWRQDREASTCPYPDADGATAFAWWVLRTHQAASEDRRGDGLPGEMIIYRAIRKFSPLGADLKSRWIDNARVDHQPPRLAP